MINLLPSNEKRALKREYRLRLAATWLGFIFAITLMCFVALLPSYFLSYYRLTENRSQIPVGTQAAERLALVSSLTNANTLESVLAPAAAAIEPSGLIDLVVKDKGADNAINTFLYSEDSNGTITMTIEGVAATRDSLLAFTQALQKEYLIANVDLPISDLTSDAKVPFSIVVTAKS